jgi:hypothetical protein
MSLTMSPHLYSVLADSMSGMGILGGKRCRKGLRRTTIKSRVCRKPRGRGILGGTVLGGCQYCMGMGCQGCMMPPMSGMGMIGGANKWIRCLKKLHNRKDCQAQRANDYPILKRKKYTKKAPAKKRAPAKRKMPAKAKRGLKEYHKILKDIMNNNPTLPYPEARKRASQYYKRFKATSGPYESTEEFLREI